MSCTLREYCETNKNETLLREWNPVRNGTLTPDSVSYGSKRRVWWRCGKGHEWQAAVYSRTKGSGCPVCAGTKLLPGENDLASVSPELVLQWHPAKNGTLTPADVMSGTHRRVWWRCGKGHEWQATVKSRSEGSGCPICTGKQVVPGENDLTSRNPELAAQWDSEKNNGLLPSQVSPGSHRKVWWRCEKGHEWQAVIASRVSGCGCPVCAGKVVVPGENDLESLYPGIAAQWHPTRNGELTPQKLSPCSNRKVWWLCGQGHEYQASVSARSVHNSGCPYCAGHKVMPGFNDLESVEPKLAAQWHPTLNGALTPRMVTCGSRKKVWWRCASGHEWKAVIYSRASKQRCGCPVCAGRVRVKRYQTGDCLERL